MAKITTDEYKEKLKMKAPDYECLGEYVGSKVKTLHRHKICGYEWEVIPNRLLTGGGCPHCKKIIMSNKQMKTHEQYVSDLAETNPEFEVLEEYKGNKTQILHRHKLCGYEWKVAPNNMLNRSGCPNCRKAIKNGDEEYRKLLSELNDEFESLEPYIRMNKSILHRHKPCGYVSKMSPKNVLDGCGCRKCMGKAQKTNEDYVKELSEFLPDYETLEEYQGSNKKILHRHKTCGFEWMIEPNRLHRDMTCPFCSKKVRKDTEYYKKELSDKFPEYEVIEDYVNKSTKILHRHKVCGYEWKITPGDILHGYGCPNCSKSKGEFEISNYLNKIKEPYEMYHTYEGLYGVGGGLLNYDFYLPKRNILIEFQGLQHEKPIEWFGGEERFKIQQEHDRRKRNYAKDHNIELLEIWYYDFNNIEQILESRLLKQSA